MSMFTTRMSLSLAGEDPFSSNKLSHLKHIEA